MKSCAELRLEHERVTEPHRFGGPSGPPEQPRDDERERCGVQCDCHTHAVYPHSGWKRGRKSMASRLRDSRSPSGHNMTPFASFSSRRARPTCAKGRSDALWSTLPLGVTARRRMRAKLRFSPSRSRPHPPRSRDSTARLPRPASKCPPRSPADVRLARQGCVAVHQWPTFAAAYAR